MFMICFQTGILFNIVQHSRETFQFLNGNKKPIKLQNVRCYMQKGCLCLN